MTVDKIIINLTPKQLKALQPLFDEANAHPLEGCVFGQAWGSAKKAAFSFATPSDVRHILRNAEAEARRLKKSGELLGPA